MLLNENINSFIRPAKGVCCYGAKNNRRSSKVRKSSLNQVLGIQLELCVWAETNMCSSNSLESSAVGDLWEMLQRTVYLSGGIYLCHWQGHKRLIQEDSLGVKLTSIFFIISLYLFLLSHLHFREWNQLLIQCR